MWLAPNFAFALFVVGLLGVYCEFIFPGRILPGVAGAIATLAGAHWLLRNSPSPYGIMLLALSAPLFVLEAFAREARRGARLLCGVLGALAFTVGSCTLFPPGRGFSLALALTLSLPFSAATVFLACIANRARRNKRLTL